MKHQETAQAHSAEEAHWQQIPGDAYDQAVYQNQMLLQIHREEIRIVAKVGAEIPTLIELGCGTGQFLRPLSPQFAHVVGVDVSSIFLQRAAASLDGSGRISLMRDDAADLSRVLSDTFGRHYLTAGPERLVCCVMNTLGIMPKRSRQRVLTEIRSIRRPSDSVFLVFFDREHLAEAVETFYKTSPGLCGPIRESDVDLENGDLRVISSGYYSHWFSVSEINDLMVDADIEDFVIKKVGWSIFVGTGLIADHF